MAERELPEGWEWLPELGKDPTRLTPEQAEQLRKANESLDAASEALHGAIEEAKRQWEMEFPQAAEPQLAQRYLAIDAKGGRPAEQPEDIAGFLASFYPPMAEPVSVSLTLPATGRTTVFVVFPQARSVDYKAVGAFSKN
jgi:hypothetical protein